LSTYILNDQLWLFLESNSVLLLLVFTLRSRTRLARTPVMTRKVPQTRKGR